MNVLVLAPGVFAHVDGSERYVQGLLRALSELHADGRVASVKVLVLRDDRGRRRRSDDMELMGCASSKRALFVHTLRALIKRDLDVVVITHVLLLPLALLARMLCPRCRIVLITHGAELDTRARLLARVLPPCRPHRVVATCTRTAAHAATALRLRPTDISVLPCAVDPPRTAHFRTGLAQILEEMTDWRDRRVRRVA